MFEYIFNITNLCRLLFYTPIVFFASLVGSIAYDYITYDKTKYDNNKKKN